MQLFIHFQTSMVQPLKFGNKEIISSHILLDIWLLIHAGIKVNLLLSKELQIAGPPAVDFLNFNTSMT